jgi:hypothetical protein
MLKVLNHQIRNLISLKKHDKDWLKFNIDTIDKKDLLDLIESFNLALECFEDVLESKKK